MAHLLPFLLIMLKRRHSLLPVHGAAAAAAASAAAAAAASMHCSWALHLWGLKIEPMAGCEWTSHGFAEHSQYLVSISKY